MVFYPRNSLSPETSVSILQSLHNRIHSDEGLPRRSAGSVQANFVGRERRAERSEEPSPSCPRGTRKTALGQLPLTIDVNTWRIPKANLRRRWRGDERGRQRTEESRQVPYTRYSVLTHSDRFVEKLLGFSEGIDWLTKSALFLAAVSGGSCLGCSYRLEREGLWVQRRAVALGLLRIVGYFGSVC
ncbi:unnamed protein product [Calypogeia fissa]